MQAKSKKAVRWSTITVYEFGVGIGGSAVPKHGGPAIGLAKTPSNVWKTTVESVKGSLCRCSHRSVENDDLNGAEDSPCTCDAGMVVNRPKNRRVRWFKPLERISLLEKAGYSEKKIYRMLMESSNIAMSRRLSLQVPPARSVKRNA